MQEDFINQSLSSWCNVHGKMILWIVQVADSYSEQPVHSQVPPQNWTVQSNCYVGKKPAESLKNGPSDKLHFFSPNILKGFSGISYYSKKSSCQKRYSSNFQMLHIHNCQPLTTYCNKFKVHISFGRTTFSKKVAKCKQKMTDLDRYASVHHSVVKMFIEKYSYVEMLLCD